MNLSSLIRRLSGGEAAPRPLPSMAAPPFAPPAPQEAVCLLGDLHGSLACLERFLALRRMHFPQARLVVLGDMVDRGMDSAGVLHLLMAAQKAGAVCLMGNHEAMLLAALDRPDEAMRGWLRNGGLETLASFGITGVGLDAAPGPLADRLRAAMGPDLLAWLRGLPLWWQSGNLVATHAGMDPALPPDAQPEAALLWGEARFYRMARRDGLWVAHGHVVVDRASRTGGRIALDTGAYATGRLSYALIDPGQPPEERIVIGVTPQG